MSLPRRQLVCVVAGFCGGMLLSASSAQPVASDAIVPQDATVSANKPVPLPPPLPLPKSPVDFFRGLLAMNAAERKEFLANRTPEDQRRLLAKVREYESLKPDQRELRLRATELRWYLLPLMSTPAANRPPLGTAVPPDVRKLVEERLQQWDRLPASVQQELLENEATIHYFTQLESATEEQKRKMLESLPRERREKLEASIAQWRALPEPEQRRLAGRFNQFFDLTPKEKQKALNTLSEAERQQMERTLRAFGKLPRNQRMQCVSSFEKFAGMSLEERQLFLKSAERWCLMSPDERQAWRDLVRKVPDWPPLPPGLDGSPPPPPDPPGLRAPRLATNAAGDTSVRGF